MDDEQVTVQMLWDIEQIKQLKARYFRFIDTKDWESFRDLFTEDCQHWVPVDGEGVEEHAVSNDDYLRTIPAMLHDGITVHHGHMPEIELVNETEATGTWSMFDLVQVRPAPDSGAAERVSIMGYGHYTETYRKCADGRWRISSKRNSRLRVDVLPWDDSDQGGHRHHP